MKLNFHDVIMVVAVSFVGIWLIDKGLKQIGLSQYSIGA